jgi:hypothetical protein
MTKIGMKLRRMPVFLVLIPAALIGNAPPATAEVIQNPYYVVVTDNDPLLAYCKRELETYCRLLADGSAV